MTLEALVSAELSLPVDPKVSEIAARIAASHGTASRAVLFYGSCLRQQQLDGLMLDFYLIVSDYDEAYDRRWLARANRLIPPNVFPFAAGGLAAKYAVLSEADFAALNGPEAGTVSVWARFAQPSRLVWVADGEARQAAVRAIARATPTLLALARPLAPVGSDAIAVWKAGFSQTYAAELRAEREDRSHLIVEAEPERYVAMAEAAAGASLPELTADAALRRWLQLRRQGKLMSVLRLAKASFTFAGGIDYLAWKVNRHAGTRITLRPWQRRWPLLGAATLLPRLILQGAVR